MTSHLWRFAAGLPRLTAQSLCYRLLAGVHFFRVGSERRRRADEGSWLPTDVHSSVVRFCITAALAVAVTSAE